MEPRDERLRKRLLERFEPPADRFETYRMEVQEMLEKKQSALDQQRRVSSAMWIFLVILCTVFLLLGGMLGGEDRLWFGILACFWLLVGAVFLLRYFLDRNRLEFLKEIKALEARVLELLEKVEAG